MFNSTFFSFFFCCNENGVFTVVCACTHLRLQNEWKEEEEEAGFWGLHMNKHKKVETALAFCEVSSVKGRTDLRAAQGPSPPCQRGWSSPSPELLSQSWGMVALTRLQIVSRLEGSRFWVHFTLSRCFPLVPTASCNAGLPVCLRKTWLPDFPPDHPPVPLLITACQMLDLCMHPMSPPLYSWPYQGDSFSSILFDFTGSTFLRWGAGRERGIVVAAWDQAGRWVTGEGGSIYIIICNILYII